MFASLRFRFNCIFFIYIMIVKIVTSLHLVMRFVYRKFKCLFKIGTDGLKLHVEENVDHEPNSFDFDIKN